MKDSIARERIKGLRQLLNVTSAASDRANGLALEAAEKAVLKAESANERRFEAVNEFRATLSDQAAQFITRKEVEALLSAVNATLGRLESNAANQTGRGQGYGSLVSYAIAGAGVVIAIAAVIFRGAS